MINNSKFVWKNESGEGRDIYSKFRRSFELDSVPGSCVFQVFADTFYQLYINGRFVGFGPVRFNPDYPQYDEYEISEYLNEGKNVIAVCVNYFGAKTYKAIPNRAGFIAAGKIGSGNGCVDLSTSAGSWKCSDASEHHCYVPKLSFALTTTEVINQKYLEEEWVNADFDDSHWKDCVELKDQNSWGTLSGRYLPFMSLKNVQPESDWDIFPLNNDMDVYSFSVPFPDFHEDERLHEPFIAFATWIWSPEDQNVPFTSFWSETWLNGVETPAAYTDKYRNMKLNSVLSFNKGWNFFFGKVQVYQDSVEQFYGVPSSAGLVFAADKKLDSEYSFKHTEPLEKKIFDDTLGKRSLPYAEDDDLSDIGGWKFVRKSDISEAPCRWCAWDEYGSEFESISIEDLQGKVFSKKDYPDGFSLKVDMGSTMLVFPHVVMSGTKGSRIDMFGNEKERDDRRYVYSEFLFQVGDRIVCDGDIDHVDFIPVQPRGFRFFNITVRDIQEDICIDRLEFISASYPVEHIGSFECSDPLLNDIWKLCERTQAANMEDAYDDCVTRERGMYTFDVMIQYFNNLASFGDHKLMKRCMELYCQSTEPLSGKFRAVYPNSGTYTIPTFCLFNIEAIYNYYSYTGDRELLDKYWDAMCKNMEPFDRLSEVRKDRIIKNDMNPAPDSPEMKAGIYCGDDCVGTPLTGLHCQYTCIYLYAVECMAKMAKVVGDTSKEEYYTNTADILRKTIPEVFYDEDVKAFRSYDDRTLPLTSHASCLAARSEAVDDTIKDDVRAFIRKDLKSVFKNGHDPRGGVMYNPAHSFLVMDGLYKLDLPDVAQNFIKSGWGWFVLTDAANIPEYHDISGGMSLCHAWSASPMYFLSKAMSGINFPDLPDTDNIEINVKAYDVDWAKVKWPHAKGVITVEWHMEDDKRIFDVIDVPEGVNYTIID